MSIREYEAHNITPPLKNSDRMKCIANLVVSTAGITQDLAALFEKLGAGHYLTVQADGAKVYLAFSANASGSIDAFATGNGDTICWPVPDGVSMPVVPVGGREMASGYGVTAVSSYRFVHARVASGGVATGYLRFYRSSFAPNQDAGEFKRP
jgi:hypothetical protein